MWWQWLLGGLGALQTIQSMNLAQQAQAGLSPEQKRRMRRQGRSSIGANLAERGLLDSSLYTGGLASLEREIAEARNPNADLLWQQAMGLGQSGGAALGNLAQMYMLQQLFGQNGVPGTSGTFIPGNRWSHLDPWSP